MTVDIETIGIAVSTEGVVKGTKDLDNFDRQANKSSKSADGLSDSIGGMVKSFIGISAAYAGFQKLANVLDEYTKYTVIVKNATAGQNEFNAAMADIRRIANTAQTDVAGLATTYARFSNALKEFGATQSQVSTLTETVALALKANGASAMETSSAMIQLSQAFGAGRLSGDEFRSMAEAAPNLMRALAASIGVSVGALKEMGAEGKLTSDVLLKAFTDPALLQALRGQAKEVITISGSWQKLKNEIEASFTAFESATGFVGSLAISIAQLADGIKIIRGFFSRDTVGNLNNELSTAMDKLAAYRRGNAFYRQVLGGREYETELRTKIAVLSRQLKDATTGKTEQELGNNKQAIQQLKSQYDDFVKHNPLKDLTAANEKYAQSLALVNANALAGNISNDEANRYRKQLEQERDASVAKIFKTETTNAKTLAELQQDLSIEFYQDERKRLEKIREIQAQYFIEDIQDETKRLKKREETEEKFYKYKNKLEQELNGQIKKFNDMQDDAQYKAIKKRAEAYKKEYDRISDNLSRSLTDAIFRGFEEGKSFIDNFIDTLKNAFKTTILQPTIQMIIDKTGITALMATISSAITGTANAASLYDPTASDGDILSRGVDIVKSITKGFDTLNGGFQSSIEKLGAWIANSDNLFAREIGGALGQYSQGISQALGIAGAAYAGFNFIKQGNYAGAALTAGGYALGGPVGAGIGAAIGSLFGSKGLPPRVTESRSGKFSDGIFSATNGADPGKRKLGMASTLDALNEQFSKNLNTILNAFDINSTITTNSLITKKKNTRARFAYGVDGAGGFAYEESFGKKGTFEQAFNALLENVLGQVTVQAIKSSTLPDGIKALFDGLTDKTQVSNMINASIGLANAQDALISQYGLTADTAGKVAVASGYAGDQLAQFANALAATALSSQKTSTTIIKERDALKDLIGSLPDSVTAFDAILKSINATTADGQKQFADLFELRDRFAKYTSAFDGVVNNVESAIYGLLSPSEKMALDQANLAKAFAELNLSVPTSITELIALGKSIDYGTEAGLDLALAFPALVSMFNQTETAAKSLSDTLNANYFSTRADFMSAKASNSPQTYIKNQAQMNTEMLAEIKKLQQDGKDTKAVMLAVAEYTAKFQRTIEDWDAEGMPAVRVDV